MKILIVGGVAGGMSAAARLRRLDEQAEIIVFERNRYVSFANCGLPYHIGGDIKNRDSLLVITPDQLRANLNINVRTGHMVTEIDRAEKTVKIIDLHTGRPYQEGYDKLVLAQGGAAVRLPLPGVDHPRIFTLQSLTDMDAIKAAVDGGSKHAVVIGGGYIGVEMTEALCQRGLAVHLVELQEQVMPPLDPEMATDLRYHMEFHGVTFHLGVSAQKFQDVSGRVQVTLSDDTTIKTDLVLMAAGVRAISGLAQHAGLAVGDLGGVAVNPHQQTSDPDIYAVGDMVEVKNTITDETAIIALAGPANRQGRIAADHIKGRDSAYRSTQGTAIVKVFEMTGGGTGISEKQLRQRNQPYHKVYLHPSGHASYYPGTASMHMKLLFTPDEGKILGAQIVGFDGVDKRLDVLATAIRAGLTVYDLEHFELAYAPPYGSAKDPVNMAGFLATNLLRGDVQFWYPENYPDNTSSGTLLDVRTQNEHDTWHIPGSVHIPLRELRGRLDELNDLPSPLYIYCLSGFRSYLAYRIAYQAGHADCSTLAGGVKTFNSFHRTELATGERPKLFVSHAEDEMLI
ncbi:FAD-dependent oxidoreductase [Anaerolineales bacterium HSG6]|nr:FAD-dependent oxidoreductase [Anaerolineales bacterium HSG6]